MGILGNTVSLCQFIVDGVPPSDQIASWAGGRLQEKAFRSIEQSAEEESIGWVDLLDFHSSDFSLEQSYSKDRYLCFSLRRDQRRLPAALVRRGVKERSDQFLQEHPGLKRVPKGKKEEILDLVRGQLLARTFPVPATYDAVWDLKTGRISLTTLNAKIIEIFEQLFKTTFEGSRLRMIHPLGRADALLDEAGQQTLEKLDQASSDSVVDQIRENRWIGVDFMLWMLHETLTRGGKYRISTPGFELEGLEFVSYLNDRLVLVGGAEEGVQKITVAGPQDSFHEVKTALSGGKEITEATLYLEKAEEAWKLTLKGDSFHFGSYRCPNVTLEKDDITDEQSEKEAIFLERMLLLEQGLQCFESLFAAFLAERLAPAWPQRTKEIALWLSEEN